MSTVSIKVFNRLWNTVQNALSSNINREFPVACFMDTHTFVCSRPKTCGGSIHAEINLLESFFARTKKIAKKEIFVFKLSKNDRLMNAKPCRNCIEHMRITKSVQTIYYSSGTDDIFLWEKISSITNRPSTYFLFLEAYNNVPVATKIHHNPRYISCQIKGVKLTGELRRLFDMTVNFKKNNYE